MDLDINIADIGSILFGQSAPHCKQCKKQDRQIEMVVDWSFSHRQSLYVSVWRCPRCSREVQREIDGEVKLRSLSDF